MKIAVSGASSFTGYWIVRELSKSGHEVIALLRSEPGAYRGVRGQRVRSLVELCECVIGGHFGSGSFLDWLRSVSALDIYCHHAAEVRNYKGLDFDVEGAVENNTRNLGAVLAALEGKGCEQIVVTGSAMEGAFAENETAAKPLFPYALSKRLTWQVFRDWGGERNFRLGRFIVPNPFGPLEEQRFTAYLMTSWLDGETATVKGPRYIRDNIHVCLLAMAYRRFVENLGRGSGVESLSPSAYIESQGAFADRLARQMETRLGVPCRLNHAEQREFLEPRVCINSDPIDSFSLGFEESEAWDALASYYLGAVRNRAQ